MDVIPSSKSKPESPNAAPRFAVTDRAWVVGLLFFGTALIPLAIPVGPLARGFVGNALGIGLVLWLSSRDGKGRRGTVGGSPGAAWAAAGLVYGIIAYAAAPLWGRLIPDALGQMHPIPWLSNASGVMAIAWVASSAIAEESFFRGYLLPRFASGEEMKAVLTTAALFAVVHPSPPTWPQLFIDGLAYGFLRSRSGSLLPPFLAHGLYNLLVVASWKGAF